MEVGGPEEGVERVEDSKDLQQQSKALDSLLTMSKIASSIPIAFIRLWRQLLRLPEADRNAMRLREKELAAVKINPLDVDIIANELELDKKVAERTLREHKGDAVAAIRHLLA
ncbi:unnamed protein product [Rhodiola kirilowii]